MVRVVAVFCIAAASAFVHAEVLELEGTVKSIDTSAHTITVERKTAKGVKTLDLEVNKRAGDLHDVTVGAGIVFSYDTTTEIITRFAIVDGEASGHTVASARTQSNSGLAGKALEIKAATDAKTVQQLTPEQARGLVASAGETLALPLLRRLTKEAAYELATYRERSDVCTHTVEVPVQEERSITYSVMVPREETKTLEDGSTRTVTKSCPETRTRFVTVTKKIPETREHRCPLTLVLGGLNTAESDVLKALAQHDGTLSLPGIEEVDIEDASLLAAHKGGTLALDGIKHLDADVVNALAKHQGTLSLNGVQSLSPEAAQAFLNHRHDLSLDGLQVLDASASAFLGSRSEPVSLRGLKEASEAAVYRLKSWASTVPAELVPKHTRSIRVAQLYAETRYAEAETLATDEVTAREEESERFPEHLVSSLIWLGMIRQKQQHFENAESTYQRAMLLCKHTLGKDHPKYFEALRYLGSLYGDQEKHEEAALLFQEALRGYEDALGPDHLETAETLVCYAKCCSDQGSTEKAEHLYRRALAIHKKTAEGSKLCLASTLMALGDICRASGRKPEAEQLYTEALGIQEKDGVANACVLSTMCRLADVYGEDGKHDEAKSLLEKALSVSQTIYGPDHPNTMRLRQRFASTSSN